MTPFHDPWDPDGTSPPDDSILGLDGPPLLDRLTPEQRRTILALLEGPPPGITPAAWLQFVSDLANVFAARPKPLPWYRRWLHRLARWVERES